MDVRERLQPQPVASAPGRERGFVFPTFLAAPTLVAQVPVLGMPSAMNKAGDKIYMAVGMFGVSVVDVTNPTAPEWTEQFFLSDSVEDVSVDGNGFMVASTSTDGLAFISFSDTTAEVVSTYPLGDWAYDIAIAGSIVHVLMPDGTLEQIDISTGAQPKSLGVFNNAARALTSRMGETYLIQAESCFFGGMLSSYRLQAK